MFVPQNMKGEKKQEKKPKQTSNWYVKFCQWLCLSEKNISGIKKDVLNENLAEELYIVDKTIFITHIEYIESWREVFVTKTKYSTTVIISECRERHVE